MHECPGKKCAKKGKQRGHGKNALCRYSARRLGTIRGDFGGPGVHPGLDGPLERHAAVDYVDPVMPRPHRLQRWG